MSNHKVLIPIVSNHVSKDKFIGVNVVQGEGGDDLIELGLEKNGWVRSDICWATSEAEEGVYTWPAAFDSDYAFFLAHGIKMVVAIHDTPEMYGYANSALPPAPDHLDAFYKFTAAAVERYPEVDIWECWNEPDMPPPGFAGYCGAWEDPFYYGKALAGFYDAVKAVNPLARVMFGGLIGDHESSPGYFNNAVAAGAKFDIVGLHLYQYAHEPFERGMDIAISLHAQLTRISPGCEIWLTETSCLYYGSPPPADADMSGFERTQAAWIDVISEWRDLFKHIFWYTSRDPVWKQSGLCKSGRRKPAWFALAERQ